MTSPALVARLRSVTEAWQDWWRERAAHREYDGGQARDEAEDGAWDDLTRAMAREEEP